ncbi:SAP30-binding protein isoform X2 [Lepisosteus oculatus]|uniref:SAP30-binding protein isoform X2 n=1 Tax=Lepisosteus oculatus TaxID=7918 RepID=UPI00073FBF95|nr:PREDICTED: SAP30-binding protein isoform X1 [Lepisosteus oculatus]
MTPLGRPGRTVVKAMASGKKSTLLSSLAAYESEQESDTENEEPDSRKGLVSAGYGKNNASYMDEEDRRDSGDEDSGDSSRNSEEDDSDLDGLDADDAKEISEGEKRDPNELVAQFSERVRNMSPDEIRIPPEPPGRCSSHLQEKIQKLYERKLHGDFDTNSHIQNKKEFRNPSIYEKLIQYCGIDELGTNYPKDMFDPHGWSEDSYYEALAKAQKVEMDKLEKAKKERTKPYHPATHNWQPTEAQQIEFVTGTKKGTTTSSASSTTSTASTTAAEAQKRKSKWDSAVPVTIAQPTILTTTATLPGVVSVTTTASGTKTTVISAVGTILKKAKQ